jgi:hypothetical protein
LQNSCTMPALALLRPLWHTCEDTRLQITRSILICFTMMCSASCCVRCCCLHDSQPVKSEARQCTGGDDC